MSISNLTGCLVYVAVTGTRARDGTIGPRVYPAAGADVRPTSRRQVAQAEHYTDSSTS